MQDGALEDDALVDYVSRALALRDRGEEPRLDELCSARPELIDRVSAMLARAAKLAGYATTAHAYDGLQGRVLEGRYRLDARLGAGAMGIVYRASDTKLGRVVAVKVLRPELFGGLDAEKRFLRESEVLAAMRHPNVVAVYDRGSTADGVSFLVMELLDGQSLVALLDEHQRRVDANAAALDDIASVAEQLGAHCELESTWLRQAVRWAAQLASGLGEAHRLGILHRDVKPSNVFIGHDGRARLLDFGVAASTSHATLTAAGDAALGTPGYMAPEVITDQAAAGPAADVYGLAATLYHLLTRRPPYLGSTTNIIASVQRRDPIPVGKLHPNLPRDLHAIVDRAMARRVSERYPSMAEFESDLVAFSNHQPVRARPLTVVDRTWRRLRRSASARVAVVLVGLLAAGGAIYEWRRIADLRRETRYLDNVAQLPPGLTLERPEFRAIVDDAERAALRRLLDAAVDNAREALPTRLLRAGFLLDQGLAGAAADDMAAIADAEPSALTKALAQSYRGAATRGGVGHGALELEGLPEPASLRDRYLVAYHTLRGRPSRTSIERDIAWFEDADPAWLPAQEMLASELLALGKQMHETDPEAALKLFSRALETAVGVETRRGRRTATTAQQLGAAFLGQRRYAESVQALVDGCALSPWSNGLLRNLADAQRRAGDPEAAIATCESGIELRPGFLEHYQTLARVWIELGDYARARAAIASVPVSDDAAGAKTRHRIAGLTEYGIALAQLASESSDARDSARDGALAAMDHLAAAAAKSSREFRLCEAIATGDSEVIIQFLVDQWADDPTVWSTTANLAHSLPATLDADDVARLAQGLLKLAQSQSPPRPVSKPTARSAPPRSSTQSMRPQTPETNK